MATQEQSRLQGWMLFLHYLAYFVGWITASGLAFWILLQLRVNLLDIFVALQFNPWAMSAVDKFGTVIFGLGWLVFALLSEFRLREAVAIHRLRHRLVWLLGSELLILALSYGLQIAMAW